MRTHNWQHLRKGTKVWNEGDPDVGMFGYDAIVVKVHSPEKSFQMVTIKDKDGNLDDIPIRFLKSHKVIEQMWKDYPKENEDAI